MNAQGIPLALPANSPDTKDAKRLAKMQKKLEERDAEIAELQGLVTRLAEREDLQRNLTAPNTTNPIRSGRPPARTQESGATIKNSLVLLCAVSYWLVNVLLLIITPGEVVTHNIKSFCNSTGQLMACKAKIEAYYWSLDFDCKDAKSCAPLITDSVKSVIPVASMVFSLVSYGSLAVGYSLMPGEKKPNNKPSKRQAACLSRDTLTHYPIFIKATMFVQLTYFSIWAAERGLPPKDGPLFRCPIEMYAALASAFLIVAATIAIIAIKRSDTRNADEGVTQLLLATM